MPKCTVCHHPEHQAIDQALLSGEFTLGALNRKFGPSISALHRHQNHIETKMNRARRRLQEIQEQGSLLMLNAFLDHVKKGVEAAEAEGNLTGVFRGSYIGSRIIYQLGRMEGSMKLDTLHRLLTSPAWVPNGSLLPTDPKLITDLHQALIENASVFCPEPPPEIYNDDADEDEDSDESEDDEDATDDPAPGNLNLADPLLETRNSELETQIATLRQLQKLLPDLDLTLADLPPLAEKPAKNQREISEKSARKTTLCAKISQQYHIDTPSKKKLPKNPCVGRDPKGGASQSAAPPAIPAADASSAIMAGDSAPGVAATPPGPAVNEPSCTDPCPLAPDHCSSNPYSLVPDPCLIKTNALAACTGFSYDPYLPEPETANSEPRSSFYLPPVAPPASHVYDEIIPEPQAAELAAFSKNFAPCARPGPHAGFR